MTLFCFLASLTSLSWAIWVTKCFFLSDSNHNAWSWNPKLGFENTIGWCVFVAASAEIRFPVECIAACLHGWPRPDTQTPLRISTPDQLFGIFAADVFWRSIQNVCQRNRHRHVLALKQQIFYRLPAFARVQQRLDIEHYGMRKSFLFLFRIQWSFFEIMLLTLDQLETLLKNRPPSIQRSCKLPLSCKPPPALLCFFESDHFLVQSWKTLWTAMPMATMELKHRVCFPTKTIHWISCNSSFPTLATHLMMDMHTPPLASYSVQLTAFPAYALWP